MNKKNVRYQPKILEEEFEEDPVVSQRLLQNIQQKLDKSAALNGGFDKLLYKIDSIENSQNAIATKVDKIHEAIYDPDEGLFARISASKSEQTNALNGIEKKVIEISAWKEQKEKEGNQTEIEVEKFGNKIVVIENSVDSLLSFKTSTLGLAKWAMAAVGGGVITLLFKVFYTYVILK
jgi:hypothetical protein